MREYLKSMKISFIFASVFYIALGVVLLVWPDLSSTAICYTFGCLLLIYGLTTVISYFVHDGRLGSFRFELLLGIVLTALGAFFLTQPQFILSILPVFFGLYIIFDSLVNLRRALELLRLGYPKWWLALALSLAAAAFGVLILYNPFTAATTVIAVIGAALIYQGVSDLWSIHMIARLGREVKKAITPIEGEYTVLDDEQP